VNKAESTEPDPAPTRLTRQLGVNDAVVIGLGSMIGAGVFAAIGPAAQAAGSGLLIGLAIAAVVAYCNATSSARLAALYPSSGGTYVYGRERLGHVWGFLAGWGFVVGKTASCAAMALTFGAYAAPGSERILAVAAVVGITAANLAGVRKTVWLTRVIVAVVLTVLVVVVGSSFSATGSWDEVFDPGGSDPLGVLRSAGLLFFAFAGYARIATLGEEVRDPRRTIPLAIPIALGITLVVYAAVAVSALFAVGPDALADSIAPLTTAVRAGPFDWAVPLVRIGAAVGSAGVLLSLLVGVSRTTFAMAGEGDLPRPLAAVHPVRKVPQRAELAVAAVVVAVVCVADLRGAIGFSSFAVLGYYAVANAAALTLRPDERSGSRVVSMVGLGGCALLAATLPTASVFGGGVLFTCGLVVWLLVRRMRADEAGGAPS